MARCESMIHRNNNIYLLQKNSDRPLVFPEEGLDFTGSAHIDPDSIPTTVAQPYPQFSKKLWPPTDWWSSANI